MTKKEARNLLNNSRPKGNNAYSIMLNEALDMAVEALEQEPVLDKIRTEIKEYKSRRLPWGIGVEDLETGKQIALNYVLGVIDEYKAESDVDEFDNLEEMLEDLWNATESEEERMNIKLDEGAFKPIREHKTDAGLDLRTPEEFVIKPNDSYIIDTGVHIELPKGYYGKLESKSGLNVKHNIVCLGGTIDEPYRGSIVVKLYNVGKEEYRFNKGDKIVQLVIQPYLAPDIEYTDKLSETDRGDNGFGSTGK